MISQTLVLHFRGNSIHPYQKRCSTECQPPKSANILIWSCGYVTQRSERGLLCKQCPGPGFFYYMHFLWIHPHVTSETALQIVVSCAKWVVYVHTKLASKLHNPVILALLHTCEVAAGNRGGLVGPIFGGGWGPALGPLCSGPHIPGGGGPPIRGGGPPIGGGPRCGPPIPVRKIGTS